jgi:hypothetical protein
VRQSWQSEDLPSGDDFMASPASGGLSAVGALGTSAVFLTSRRDAATSSTRDTFIALDLATDTWHSLGSAPLPGILIGACATDAGVVAVGSQDLYDGRPVPASQEYGSAKSPVDPTKIETSGPDVAEYSEADGSWRTPTAAADLQVNIGGFQVACWPGGLIGYGAIGNEAPLQDVAVRLDADNLAWTKIAAPAGLALTSEHAWTGSRLVVWGANAKARPTLVYDPISDTWTEAASGPFASTEIGYSGGLLAYDASGDGDQQAQWTRAEL